MTERRTSRSTRHLRPRAWLLWRGRGRRAWEAARWIVIAGLFVTALVLGWIGFDLNGRALGQPGSFLDNLYRSLQLFLFRSGAVSPPVSWQLEVARWLAPVVAAGAAVSAMVALLGERLLGLRIRFSSDHDKLGDALSQVGLARGGGGLRIEYFNVAGHGGASGPLVL